MSFLGNIASGIGALFSSGNSAPKIDTKNITQSIATPFYNYSKGTLTPTAAATGTGGFGSIFSSLGDAANSFAGINGSLSGVGGTLSGIGSSLADMRSMINPANSAITNARVNSIRDAAASSLGDLRSQLSQRSVLGSSFGNDTESRTKLAFAQAEEQAKAQGILDSIGANIELAKTEMQNQAVVLGLSAEQRANVGATVTANLAQAQVLSSKIGVELQQFGMAAGVAGNLNQVMSSIALNQAQLDMMQSQINAQNLGYGLQQVGSLGGLGSGTYGLGSPASLPGTAKAPGTTAGSSGPDLGSLLKILGLGG